MREDVAEGEFGILLTSSPTRLIFMLIFAVCFMSACVFLFVKILVHGKKSDCAMLYGCYLYDVTPTFVILSGYFFGFLLLLIGVIRIIKVALNGFRYVLFLDKRIILYRSIFKNIYIVDEIVDIFCFKRGVVDVIIVEYLFLSIKKKVSIESFSVGVSAENIVSCLRNFYHLPNKANGANHVGQ